MPTRGAPDQKLIDFAASFNGYEVHGSFERAAAVSGEVTAGFDSDGALPDDLDAVRTALFFQYRAHRHGGGYGAFGDIEIVWPLIERIRDRSGGRVHEVGGAS